MLISMRTKQRRDLLVRLGFGRLVCSSNDRPFIVPMYFWFEADRLYGFSTVGQKILWMRQNPPVCVKADEIHAHDDRQS